MDKYECRECDVDMDELRKKYENVSTEELEAEWERFKRILEEQKHN